MKEGHGTILDSKDIDKDCTCRLWTKNSLFGKAEFDIKASKKENRAMSDAAVSGCIVKKKQLQCWVPCIELLVLFHSL